MLHWPTRSSGRFGGRCILRPERLAQAQAVGLQARSLAILQITAILHDIRRLMQKAEGRRIQRPIGLASRREDFLAPQEPADDAVLDGHAVSGQHEILQDRRDGSVVPKEIVALSGHPRVVVQRFEGHRPRPDAVRPDRMRVILLKVASQAIQREGGPLLVP